MKRCVKLFLGFFIGALILANPVFSQEGVIQEQKVRAEIVRIKQEEVSELGGIKQRFQRMDVRILEGDKRDQIIEVENGNIPSANAPHYKSGDQVILTINKDPTGQDLYFISDFVRTTPLYWLAFIFILLVALVGRKRGIASIFGMVFSYLIIFLFLLPNIAAGRNPVLIAIISAILIIPVTFYLSHGINRKTNAAVIATVIALLITGLLASIFVEFSKLSGFASEEAGFLQVAKGGSINIKGLLLAGIIIGILGILDDVTVSQASVVSQLKKTAPHLKPMELFSRSMDVGRDHIASVVNTLILVYTGASLPLLLLFIDNPAPINQIINTEIIAEEIVRTLVASIGLILAVPLSSLIAAFFIFRKQT